MLPVILVWRYCFLTIESVMLYSCCYGYLDILLVLKLYHTVLSWLDEPGVSVAY